MKSILRAAGVAAAAFLFAPGAAQAGPLPAASFDAAQDFHGGALIAAADLDDANTLGPAAAATPLAASPGHDAATVAAPAIGLADAAVSAPSSLADLVAAHAAADLADPQQHCLAGAVYFEARGEALEGQLAVAEVVMNRAASGKYPASLCGVVKQRSQFSFVRGGRFPPIDKACDAWRKAVAIARIASDKLATKVASNVLWYHANYVSPSWGRRLTRVTRIGTHIFYS